MSKISVRTFWWQYGNTRPSLVARRQKPELDSTAGWRSGRSWTRSLIPQMKKRGVCRCWMKAGLEWRHTKKNKIFQRSEAEYSAFKVCLPLRHASPWTNTFILVPPPHGAHLWLHPSTSERQAATSHSRSPLYFLNFLIFFDTHRQREVEAHWKLQFKQRNSARVDTRLVHRGSWIFDVRGHSAHFSALHAFFLLRVAHFTISPSRFLQFSLDRLMVNRKRTSTLT